MAVPRRLHAGMHPVQSAVMQHRQCCSPLCRHASGPALSCCIGCSHAVLKHIQRCSRHHRCCRACCVSARYKNGGCLSLELSTDAGKGSQHQQCNSLLYACTAIVVAAHWWQSVVLAGAHSTSSCLQMFINTNNDPLQYPGGFLCSLRHTPAHVLYR